MKKIFFSCSMRGGHKNITLGELKGIIEAIESSGFELVTKHHQVEKDILVKEKKLTHRQIHDRDLGWLKQADFVVAEISDPSLGVGAEVTDAVHMKKPVLCIYKKSAEESVSAYLRGKPGVESFGYDSLEQVKGKITGFAEKK